MSGWSALQANDPDTFKRWLYGGIEDLGEPAVTELQLELAGPLYHQGWTGQDRGVDPWSGRYPSWEIYDGACPEK